MMKKGKTTADGEEMKSKGAETREVDQIDT